MMFSEKMEKALNGQLIAETYSAYLYLSMSAYFKAEGLEGCASWMFAQAQEELTHALKFYDYINQRGGRVMLTQIDAPPTKWDSSLAVFEDTLNHEQKVTGLINALMDIAIEERDHASQIFLQWFVTEQIEEEESVGEVLTKLKMLNNVPGGMFTMDQDLGQRKAISSVDTARSD
jgi:ferritin